VEMRKKEYLSMVIGYFLGHPRNSIGMVIALSTIHARYTSVILMQHL